MFSNRNCDISNIMLALKFAKTTAGGVSKMAHYDWSDNNQSIVCSRGFQTRCLRTKPGRVCVWPTEKQQAILAG